MGKVLLRYESRLNGKIIPELSGEKTVEGEIIEIISGNVWVDRKQHSFLYGKVSAEVLEGRVVSRDDKNHHIVIKFK
jgi:hypothetical protein